MAEHRLQPGLHGLCPLVGASCQPDGKAGMIVDDGQGMQPGAAAKPHPPLEVHLPERVRRKALEAAIGAAGAVRRNPAMTRQHRMHRGDRRRRDPRPAQHRRDLAGPPCRMRLAHRQDPRLQSVRQPARTMQRPARAIAKIALARRKPPQPQMTRLPADPEPLAQRRYVGPCQRSQHHELPALIRHRHLPPAHPNLPAVSRQNCQASLRTLSGISQVRTLVPAMTEGKPGRARP